MRAVLDPNVVISALLAPAGTPARVLQAWLDGAFELVVSNLLLAELERALGYPKLRRRVTPAEVAELLDLLRSQAELSEDPNHVPSIRSSDPGDDYLIALAASVAAVIVSGDRHLLAMSERIPVLTPAAFLDRLDS